MVKQAGPGSQIVKLDRQIGVNRGAAAVRYSSTSPAPENAGAPYEALARNLAQVSNRLENRLDALAAEQAQAEGSHAGLVGDVALRRDATIRGAAFDAAAKRSMIARHDTQARLAADEIYQRHKDSPGTLDRELTNYADGVDASNLPQEVKDDFSLSFARLKAGYMSDATARAERLQLDSDRAAALENMEMRRRSIERLARLSESDAAAAVMMAAEIDEIKKFALRHGPRAAFEFDGKLYEADPARSGAYTLEDIQRLVMTTSDTAREQRIIGKFLQAGSYEEKSRMLEAFEQEFSSGKSDFDLEQYDRLSGRMRADLNRDKAEINGRAAAVNKELSAVNRLIEKGYSPGKDVMDSLEVRAALSGDPQALPAVQEMRSMIDFQDIARQKRPAELEGFLQDSYSRIREKGGITPEELARMEVVERLKDNMSTELTRDALSWGGRVGLVNLKPIDFKDPESLRERVAAASTISSYYGTPLQLMTREETAVWKNSWDMAAADDRTAMIALIQDGFGEDSIYVFNDLANVSPAVANVGGLLTQSESHAETARDFAIGDAALAAGTKLVGEDGITRYSQTKVLGNAYGWQPRAMNAVLETAERLYTAKALRQGLTVDNFNDKLYEESLQQASGAWTDRRGMQHGGIIEYKSGHHLVLPPNMTQQDFEKTLSDLNDFTLVNISVGGGAGLYESGDIMTPVELRRGFLVSSGPGRYLVSTTNPSQEPPSFLHGTNPDGLFEIDVMRVKGGLE